MAIGDTDAVPSASERFCGKASGVKPKRVMYSRAKRTPIASSRRTDTRFFDWTSASRRRIGPLNLLSSFAGVHMPSGRDGSGKAIGASLTIDAGVKPRSNAAEYK